VPGQQSTVAARKIVEAATTEPTISLVAELAEPLAAKQGSPERDGEPQRRCHGEATKSSCVNPPPGEVRPRSR
jgi:hypothetical protein